MRSLNPHFDIQLDSHHSCIRKDFLQLSSEISNFAFVLQHALQDFYAHKNTTTQSIAITLSDTYNFFIAFFASLTLTTKVFLPATQSKQEESLEQFVLDDASFLALSCATQASNTHYSPKQLESALNDSCFTLQTSGSSGEPTNITKTFQQMLYEARVLQQEFQIQPNDIIMASISHAHLYGLTFRIFLPLVSGATMYSQSFSAPEYVLHYIQNHQTAIPNLIFCSSPSFLSSLSMHEQRNVKQSLKILFCAGAKLEDSIKERLGLHSKIIEIYGSSETGIIAKNTGNGFFAFPEVTLSLDENNCLVIASPWCNQNNNECTRQASAFHSKDCATIESNGKITLLGRKDRILKLHDKRISLDSIEQTLNSHEYIQQSYVGLRKGQNRLSALLVLSKEGETYFRQYGKKGLSDTIKGFLKPHFGNAVRYFSICDTLPFNSQGKITYQDFLLALDSHITPTFILLSQDDTTVHAKAYIGPSLFYFSGHFHTFPLVPGFIELGFVYDLAKHLNIHTQDIIEIENVKFSTFLRPSEWIFITLEYKNNKLYFSLKTDKAICASGRMLLSHHAIHNFCPTHFKLPS
ncbi:hypothetical protein CQA66_00110 [Helicobacter aurati]|uniref:Uncharacterized protein n=1 Tax=Helicobacter aurati TaxID=137778 RepID=A0A3D8J883_9HELI|nr:AMP-binding protein [Helicobacter aurati]RDU73638.1 hypothetical protein CQA66_00110 [Helicobacter aurati]